MAHMAQLVDGIVTQVIVVGNDKLLVDGVEVEQAGIDFCKQLLGADTNWVQTSYNGNFRKRYAGIGYSYDVVNDVFIAPQPYASWVLNADFEWIAPVEMPTDGYYRWDESTLTWIGVPNE